MGLAKSRKFKVTDPDFKRSTYTTCNGAWCVEVAVTKEGIAVRDGKKRNRGILFFTNNEWQAFINGVKKGEFDTIGRISTRLRR